MIARNSSTFWMYLRSAFVFILAILLSGIFSPVFAQELIDEVVEVYEEADLVEDAEEEALFEEIEVENDIIEFPDEVIEEVSIEIVETEVVNSVVEVEEIVVEIEDEKPLVELIFDEDLSIDDQMTIETDELSETEEDQAEVIEVEEEEEDIYENIPQEDAQVFVEEILLPVIDQNRLIDPALEGRLITRPSDEGMVYGSEVEVKLAEADIEGVEEGDALAPEIALATLLAIETSDRKLSHHADISRNDLSDELAEDLYFTLLASALVEGDGEPVISQERSAQVLEAFAQTKDVPEHEEGVFELFLDQLFSTNDLNEDEKSLISVTAHPQMQGAEQVEIPFEDLSFESGSVVLVIDPIRRFTPGDYTLEIELYNPITDKTQVIEQDFSWGVLAMNFDQDAYAPDTEAEIHLGILDTDGLPVCGVEMELEVMTPDGAYEQIDVEEMPTCELLEVGNILPDYRAAYTLGAAGAYTFSLRAEQGGHMRELREVIDVQEAREVTISRTSATRNFPYGPTPMFIDLSFDQAFSGQVFDLVPRSFDVTNISSGGFVQAVSEDVQAIYWDLSAYAGQTVHLSYDYDAPDISPEFYTIGPMQLFTEAKIIYTEQRYWLIANDAAILKYAGPSAWDIDGLSDANSPFDVNPQETNPTEVEFNDDGTKMYVLGDAGNDVNEYDLSTAWDVSTATYNQNFSVSSQEASPFGLAFSTDGTKMYVIGSAGDDVNEYDLSTAWDISTASYNQNFSVSGQETNPRTITFHPDGTKMFIAGQTGDDVNEYTLSTAWDVSTASFVDALSVIEEPNPQGIAFSADGKTLYAVGLVEDDISIYSLTTGWDVSTGTFVSSTANGAIVGNPHGIAFNHDGSKLYIIATNDDVEEYDIPPGDFDEIRDNDGSILSTDTLEITLYGDTFQDTDADNVLDVGSEVTINNVSAGLTAVMTLSDSDTKVTLTLTGTATNHANANDVSELTFVFDDTAFTGGSASAVTNSGDASAYASGIGIDFDDYVTDGVLKYAGPTAWDSDTVTDASSPINVSANVTVPIEVTLSLDGTKMYVFGSKNDQVHQYALSTAWDISTASYTQGFDVNSEQATPRGLAFSTDGLSMYVVGRGNDTVAEYVLTTAWDVSTASYVQAFDVSSEETDVHDVIFNHDGTKMYVTGFIGDDVNEYALSTAWDVSTASYTDLFSVATEESNPEGIAFNHDGTALFVIGALDDDLTEYSLSTAWDVSTGTHVSSTANGDIPGSSFGIAFNHNGTKVYFANNGPEIDEYDIDGGNMGEAGANDGSIDGADVFEIAVHDRTFQDTDADNVLDIGSEVTVGNVPAGLTAVMTLSANDQVVTLSFTGNATSHQNANDISDLTFVFDDTAFTNDRADGVQNSGDASAYSSNIGIDFDDNVAAPGGVSGNLQLWLKADEGVTGSAPITAWADQSSSSNDIATVSGDPGLQTDAMNYNPAIRFDGVGDALAGTSAGLTTGATDYATFVVYKDSGSSTAADVLNLGNAANDYRLQVNSTTGYQYRDSSPYTAFTATQSDINILVSDNDNGGSHVSYLNGKSMATDTKGSATTSGAYSISRTGDVVTGDIAEVIVYNDDLTALSATAKQRIESYLAVKYGVTIDQTTATDYIASDGTTQIWDKDVVGATTYDNDIAVIGRDDGSELGQVKSQSVNSDAILTIEAESEGTNATPSFTDIADMEFLSWGNDNGATTETTSNIPAEATHRLTRIWQVQEAGDVGTLTVSADLNALSVTGTTASEFHLIIDADTDFTSGATIVQASSYTAGIATFNTVSISDEQYLAIGTGAGTLSVDIVDSGGSSVASPSVSMTTPNFSFDDQVTTGTLGAAAEKVRVNNDSATATWTLSAAATATTTTWTDGGQTFDFNDSTANAGDGGDADSVGGQLTVNASGGTVTPEGGCSSTGITLGSSSAFQEGVVDSISILSAGGGADTGCHWDLTNVSLSQTVPSALPASDYTIDIVLTVV